mmetsp:Transcript_29760/g.45109  ORF Transcript_29760/g.45109 Transcript_29760/m.45109 type:complete len:551 (-) Transcript_29760:311-1963(-)
MTALKRLKIRTSKLSRNNTTDQSNSSAPIERPEDLDILLGRTKISFNHVGNRKFRVFIDKHLQRYMDAQSRMEKTLVVNSVVEAIQDGGGRFLKQDNKTKKWYKVSAKMAREKVGHALRDGVGMQMKSVRGNQQGATQAVAPGATRRASGFAQARRASATEVPRPDLRKIEKNSRNARSCGALITKVDSDLQKNSMILNAQKVAEEIRAFGNEEEEEAGKKIAPGGSSELLFNDAASGKRIIPVDPISIKVKNTYVNKDSSSKNIVSFPKPPTVQFSKRASAKKLSNGSDHLVPTRMFDGDSAELSIMSEGTTEKWFDFGSGRFSVGTVDSEVFDDNDDIDPSLVDQVNKRLTDLEFAGERAGKGKKNDGKDLFRWKQKEKFSKLSGKSMANDVDISEEFSTMSLDTRSKAEEDYILKSEEFGLKSEELTRCSTLKSEEFGFKSDEFSLDGSMKNANSAEFLIKVEKFSDASQRNSSEVPIRNSSKAKIIQTKGLMDTVDEGAVLDNEVIARINNKSLGVGDSGTAATVDSEDFTVKSDKKSGLLESGIS